MHAITVRPTDKTDSKGRHRPGPECIEWTEVPTPKPGPGEVLVKVKAAGINRGDLLQRQGLYPPPKGVSETMGLEVTGVISSLGPGVTGWSEDDEVIALLAGGGYAEYVIVPAGQLLPIPEGIDPVTASTLIEVTATVISNMDHVGLARGETFLVHGGAGGIGQFAIQYAKSLECTVITIPAALFSTALRVAPDERTIATTVGWMQQWSAFGQFAGPPMVAWVAMRAGGWHWTWVTTGALCLVGLLLTSRLAALPRGA